jgi:hypothetical protein
MRYIILPHSMKRHQRKERDDSCDDEDILVHDPEFQFEEPEVGEYENGEHRTCDRAS